MRSAVYNTHHYRIPENHGQYNCNMYSLLVLEQRANKNDSIQSKIVPILNLSRFFPHRIGGEKEQQFQSWNYF